VQHKTKKTQEKSGSVSDPDAIRIRIQEGNNNPQNRKNYTIHGLEVLDVLERDK
jgi:hypothetical protein